ncbi:DUF1419 domain-containing protein [Rhizobium bangladeshense]|uniref:DUF1419 domain-containing protein n=1 Tax=Rhizobium bangladeshense TaxID=1138189 RepID=UPI001C832203|nr:DUF1419 domain-containing protein [Rhizobium bangladeshense]MBX4899267.1 DUF1419 domain-containing protein [Rhizobium bangladeshense]MBY3617484.1 DUF1419 domain-containing protein [Rhizobium bangladeshense]
MSHLPVIHPDNRKIFEGVASRRQMYALFNRHAQTAFDNERISGRCYAGEWFEITEADHDRMFEILPPLFYRGDVFAMRECVGGTVTSVFFALRIGGRPRWFHGYCNLSDRSSIDRMRAAIIERESQADRAMTRREKLDHIWSITANDFRAYADRRFRDDFRGRPNILVYCAVEGRMWKQLDELTDVEIAAKLPVQFRHSRDAAAA